MSTFYSLMLRGSIQLLISWRHHFEIWIYFLTFMNLFLSNNSLSTVFQFVQSRNNWQFVECRQGLGFHYQHLFLWWMRHTSIHAMLQSGSDSAIIMTIDGAEIEAKRHFVICQLSTPYCCRALYHKTMCYLKMAF